MGAEVRERSVEQTFDKFEATREREDLRYVLPERARQFPWSRTAEGIERVWEAIA